MWSVLERGIRIAAIGSRVGSLTTTAGLPTTGKTGSCRPPTNRRTMRAAAIRVGAQTDYLCLLGSRRVGVSQVATWRTFVCVINSPGVIRCPHMDSVPSAHHPFRTLLKLTPAPAAHRPLCGEYTIKTIDRSTAMVPPPAPDPDAPPTPWRVRWIDDGPDADERLRTFADAWALAQPDPTEHGWQFALRDVVLQAFNAGASQMRVASHRDAEVWIHFDGP